VEAAIAVGVSAAFVLYYGAATTNYGGWSYSVRWFIALIPLLWFFSYPFFLKMTAVKRKLVTVLFAVSLFISVVGALNPWTSERPALITNLEMFHPRAVLSRH
jgi:hypothetical protein